MKRFMAIYIGTEAALDAVEQAGRGETQGAGELGHAGLDGLGDENRPRSSYRGLPWERPSALAEGVSDIKNVMAAYVIVQAESHEAAARLFENHPHFTIFPGDSVEIMECLPFPER